MTEDPGRIVVYLLHFDRPIGRAAHYVGSTENDRLPVRLIEHARGKGAALTAAAVKGGSRLYLAASWRTSDRSLERRIKRAGHLRQRCPICVLGGIQSDLFSVEPQVREIDPDCNRALSW